MNEDFSGLLEIPESLTEEDARRLYGELLALWENASGRTLQGLTDDLEYCRRWFDPVAQGQRLRRELAELKEAPLGISIAAPPLVLEVSPGRYLVTPEGRCAVDFLAGHLNEVELGAGWTRGRAYDSMLARLYRDWSRHRLQSVVDLLNGNTKPLQVSAAGVVLVLLVNRCTSADRAMTRFSNGKLRSIVDRAFFAAVEAFANVVSPGRRPARNDPRLVSGWMLYEAGRRLGNGLVIADARGGKDGSVWIRESSVPEVLALVARDLQRGHREIPSIAKFEIAFDVLVEHFRAELPALAGLGLIHERPTETARLRNEFLRLVQSEGAGP